MGSLTAVINAQTDSVTRYSYNAWGNPRDPQDWTRPYEGELFAGRGYTGHEHLQTFSLINMNGRVYDPVLARFLSPDPFVQFPGIADGLNRYSYVMNNPLIFVDPSGYNPEKKSNFILWLKYVFSNSPYWIDNKGNIRGASNRDQDNDAGGTYSYFYFDPWAGSSSTNSPGGGLGGRNGGGSGSGTNGSINDLPRVDAPSSTGVTTSTPFINDQTLDGGSITFTYKLGATWQRETNMLGFGTRTFEFTPYARFLTATLNESGEFSFETGSITSFKLGHSVANISGIYYWNRLSNKIDLRVHLGAVDICPNNNVKFIFNPFSLGHSISFYNSFETEINVPLMEVLDYRQNFFESTGIPLNR